MILAGLGTGIQSSIHRPNNSSIDRQLRALIEEKNTQGDFIIPTGNRFYFRPDVFKEVDRYSAETYLKQERARVESIVKKLNAMEDHYKKQLEQLSAEDLRA